MTREEYNNLPLPNRRLFDLIKNKTNGNVLRFAHSLDISQPGLLRLLRIDKRNGKYPDLTSNVTDKIKAVYDIDASYFYQEDEPSASQERQITQKNIPFYSDVTFGCSPSGFLGALEVGRANSYISIPGLTNDGTTFAVGARGDSMVNLKNPERSIPHGSIVVAQRVSASSPQWGEVYALSTDDGCIIKRIYPSEKENYIKCVSYNEEEYPAFERHISEIHDIAKVIAVINLSTW